MQGRTCRQLPIGALMAMVRPGAMLAAHAGAELDSNTVAESPPKEGLQVATSVAPIRRWPRHEISADRIAQMRVFGLFRLASLAIPELRTQCQTRQRAYIAPLVCNALARRRNGRPDDPAPAWSSQSQDLDDLHPYPSSGAAQGQPVRSTLEALLRGRQRFRCEGRTVLPNSNRLRRATEQDRIT